MSYLDSVTLAIEAVLTWDYVSEDLFADAFNAQAYLIAGCTSDESASISINDVIR